MFPSTTLCNFPSILTSLLEATQRPFRDGHRNFEPRSHDKDDTSAGALLAKLPHYTSPLRPVTRPYTQLGRPRQSGCCGPHQREDV
ncbi:hypothetical protein AVEN_169792-1 [Araneus ventricosus]|uniref:Uncharacterized protein n=1 Tax=Araneus ventricosus TaxID=182803 RepID=A0A4Y2KGL1_ARAVE|nr:hypothetical protein AVEN_31367-1 [Araneus ventricosus]GBN01060.1 hypothetical protein AVEN_169792-1 [Araneus ventricosus]